MSLYSDQLYTSRLALAKIQEEDLPTIVAWSLSETACGKYLTPEKYTQEQMLSQIQSGSFWNDREKMFLVKTKDDNKAIGTVHYWQPTGGRNTVTMALKVALPEERGKGYGTEIQKFLIMYIFDRLSVECIEMYTDVNNSAQQRCLEKLGFELIESLTYDDQQERRTGHLFRLTPEKHSSYPIYQFHYE
jgi:RimJ/RimL family protein N-acetyltransferase